MAESAPPIPDQKRCRTPTVLQMEAVECGAAALCMILEYYGLVLPLEEVREACGVSRDGVKASNIVRAAKKYGLDSRGYKREPHELGDLSVPMMIHWNFNHFVVFEGIKGNRVYLNDPGSGPRTVTKEEFDQAFTGVALTFTPSPEFKPGGTKRSVLMSLKSRFRDPGALLFVLISGLLLVLPGLVTPIFSKIFVDNILVKSMEGWFKPLLLGMLIAAVFKGVLTWLQQFFLLRYQTKLAVKESGKYFFWLLQLPVVFFTQRMSGDLSKRVGNNDRVAELLTGKLATAVLNMITVVFYVGLMFVFDWMLTLVGIVIVILNLVVLRMVSRLREEQTLRYMIEVNKVHGTAAIGLYLIETLKATGSETDFFAKWSGYQARFLNTAQKLGRLNYLIGVVPPFLTHLNTLAILSFGALRVINGEMTVGMLVAFQSLMVSFMDPFNELVRLGAELQEATGTMTKLDDVYRYPRDTNLTDSEHESDAPTKLSGALDIRELTFGYNPLAPPLIEDFGLTLKPGSRVALVGKSGSGKSTVGRIVAGLYKPFSGEILFDGKPRGAYPRNTIVNSVAMVDQDISLFEGTIRDNLTLWDATIPDHQLILAAKDACIHDEITSRPGGYKSTVEEGGRNFSGGQKQRLEIARGLAVNPGILVLDEATSALDPQTEQIIDRNLRRRGCTCLIVAHRLSTIRDCDEIIVMDRGKIVQRGNHDQLTQVEGLYADLIKTM